MFDWNNVSLRDSGFILVMGIRTFVGRHGGGWTSLKLSVELFCEKYGRGKPVCRGNVEIVCSRCTR